MVCVKIGRFISVFWSEMLLIISLVVFIVVVMVIFVVFCCFRFIFNCGFFFDILFEEIFCKVIVLSWK